MDDKDELIKKLELENKALLDKLEMFNEIVLSFHVQQVSNDENQYSLAMKQEMEYAEFVKLMVLFNISTYSICEQDPLLYINTNLECMDMVLKENGFKDGLRAILTNIPQNGPDKDINLN